MRLNKREFTEIQKWIRRYPSWWDDPSDFVHEAIRDFLRFLEAGGPQKALEVRRPHSPPPEEDEPRRT